jgi:hypothetical protein
MSDQRPAEAEEVVRRYLIFLEDPAMLRDTSAIEEQARMAREAEDPIAKLRALAEAERLSTVDGEALRSAFVERAHAWAEENRIPVGAFKELRVPIDVLRQAGFDLGQRRRAKRRPTAGAGTPRRGTAVSAQVIKQTMLAFAEPFTLAEVIAKIGGSSATARKAADDLVAKHELIKLSPDPNHSGRGRAPFRYGRPS